MPLVEDDFTLLRVIGDLCLERDDQSLEPEDVVSSAEDVGLERSSIDESLSVLRHRRLIETLDSINGELLEVWLTATGLDQYALRYSDGYGDLLREAAAWLAGQDPHWCTSRELASALGIQHILAAHILVVFSSRGWLRLATQESGGAVPACDISPELRRVGHASERSGS